MGQYEKHTFFKVSTITIVISATHQREKVTKTKSLSMFSKITNYCLNIIDIFFLCSVISVTISYRSPLYVLKKFGSEELVFCLISVYIRVRTLISHLKSWGHCSLYTRKGNHWIICVGVCVSIVGQSWQRQRGTCEARSRCLAHPPHSPMLEWECGNVSSDIIPPVGPVRTGKVMRQK